MAKQIEAEKQNWFRRHWIISIFLGFFVLIFINSFLFSLAGDDSSKSPTAQVTQQSNSVQDEQVIVIQDIDSFLAEFEANEIRAEGDYVGKFISVTSRVDSINEGVFGPYLILGEEYSFSGINCNFKKENQNQFIALNSGDVVTVKGEVSDYILGSVVLDDCVLA